MASKDNDKWRCYKKRKRALTNEGSQIFYMNEILPDVQERMRNTVRNDSATDKFPTHVGMDKINAVSFMGKYFVEFASNSTFHGLKHLVAPHRHPIEKFLAVLFILGSLVCLILLSFIFWQRYQHEATVTILDSDVEDFKIPKPAIIICPVHNIDVRKIPSIFERYGVEDTREARRFFTILSNISYENIDRVPDYNGAPPEKWLEILYDLRYQGSYKFLSTILSNEKWMVTERGLCLPARNYISIYASPEYWLSNNWTAMPTLKSVPHYNYDVDGELVETINSDVHMQLGILNPGEIWDYQHKMIFVHALSVKTIKFSISITVAEPTLAEISTQRRKCKFLEDKGLKMWPVYTHNACVIECRFQVIKEHCGCLPHFARPMSNVPTCNVAQLRCIGNIKHELFLHEVPPAKCKCLPNCNTVSYVVDSIVQVELKQQSPLNVSAVTLKVRLPDGGYYRLEIYGFNDFLTSVGGAAGLFLGASVLSFFEILYYILLRLIIYMIRRRRK